MKTMLKTMGRKLRALNRDDRGATMVEYMLLIAVIALPLLALLIWFGDDLWNLFLERWEDAKDESERN
jgi:Flp pilus assembly pilin Flp